MPGLLENIPLNVRREFWFMQDGAPAHFSIGVRNYLMETFPHRWIGRGSEFGWPARSPDLNPLDFYYWGHLKSLVYTEPPNNAEELWEKIENSVNFLRHRENVTLFNVRQNLIKRLRKCVEVRGCHFENLLQ